LRPSANSSIGSIVTRLPSALLTWRFGNPDMLRRALSISFETPRGSPSRPSSFPLEESTPAHRSLTLIAISSSLWGITIRPYLFGSGRATTSHIVVLPPPTSRTVLLILRSFGAGGSISPVEVLSAVVLPTAIRPINAMSCEIGSR
jgi:hypothetical protein